MTTQQEISLFHPMPLWDEPRCDASIVGAVWEDTPLTIQRLEQGFYWVSTGDGQQGYLPAGAFRPWAMPADEALRTIQPVWIYRQPAPGEQYGAGDASYPWMVLPTDTLTLLGKVPQFHFVQLESGRLGFLPAGLCTMAKDGDQRDAIRGELVLLGFGWGVGQLWLWRMLSWRYATFFPTPTASLPTSALLLCCAFALVLLLWLAGRPRGAARSFAIGLFLSICLMGMFYWLIDMASSFY